MRLIAADLDEDTTIALDLSLEGATPMVLQGDRGFSRKGPESGNASLYYSYPRLDVTGTLTASDGVHRVEGTAWFDHEWSTSVLSDDLAGWDWFALQLDGDRALMAYGLRRSDGRFSPESAATWIAADGSVRKFSAAEFSIEVIDRWRSPHTGIEYPARWRIAIPDFDLDLEVRPIRSDQELRLATVYWEGAVDTSGTIAGSPTNGVGYVELVGYGESGTIDEP